jgi:hypothetical protein
LEPHRVLVGVVRRLRDEVEGGEQRHVNEAHPYTPDELVVPVGK